MVRRGLKVLAILTLALTAFFAGALLTSEIHGSVSVAHAASRSKVPPCQAAFPDARRKTIGQTTWYNRQESVRMVLCNRFGLEPSADFPISASMVCGVLAQVIGHGSQNLSLFVDGSCSGADLTSDPKEPTKYIGIACGWAADLLGVFVKPLGALGSAGCTLAPSAGNALGGALESKHEFDVAVDVTRHGKCIKYSPTHFGSPWIAKACADGDKGFATLPVYRPGAGRGGSGPGGGWEGGGAAPGSGGGGNVPSGGSPGAGQEIECASTELPGRDVTLASNYQVVATPTSPGGSPCGNVGYYLTGDAQRLFMNEPYIDDPHNPYDDLATDTLHPIQLPGNFLISGISANGAWYGAGLQVVNLADPADTWTAPTPTDLSFGDYQPGGIVAVDNSGEGVVYWMQGERTDTPPDERVYGTYLYYARRGATEPVQLSECREAWTFSGSISADGRYVAFLDDCASEVAYPTIYETSTGHRHTISMSTIETPYISSDGERVLLSDFFGDARLVNRDGNEISSINRPIVGISPTLHYLITYSGDYGCPESLDRYDVASGTAEPVLEVPAGDCVLSRGAGFGQPQLLAADDGQTFVWNNARQLSGGETRKPQAYVVRHIGAG